MGYCDFKLSVSIGVIYLQTNVLLSTTYQHVPVYGYLLLLIYHKFDFPINVSACILVHLDFNILRTCSF